MLPALIVALLMRQGLDASLEFIGSGTDVLSAVKPHYAFIKQQWAAGELPLWNPHIAAGQPEAAGAQWGVFYPLQRVLLPLLSPAGYIKLSLFVHLALLGVFGFALVRIWLRRRGVQQPAWPAALAALALTLSGFAQGHLFAGHVPLIQALPYLALMAWGGVVVLDGRWWGLPLVAGGVALTILAGGPQILPMGLLGSFALWGTTGAPSTLAGSATGAPVCGWRPWAWLGATIVLGVALAGVQVGPSLELAAHSARSRVDLGETAALFTLSWRHAATPLLPSWAQTVQPWAAWEFDGFIGAPVLALAAVPLALPRARRTAIALWVVVLGLVVLASAPVHAIVGQLPGYAMLRVPARLWLGPTILLPLLAGWGLSLLGEHRRARSAAAVLLVSVGAASLALMVARPAAADMQGLVIGLWCALCVVLVLLRRPALRWRVPIIVLAGGVALGLAAQRRHVFAPSVGLSRSPESMVQALRDQAPRFRGVTAVNSTWNAGMAQGFLNLAGYEPLAAYRSALLFKALSGDAPTAPWRHSYPLWPAGGTPPRYSPLWDLFGVRLALTTTRFRPPPSMRTVERQGPFALHLNPQALPRAYVASCPAVVSTPEAAFGALMQQWAAEIPRPAAIEGIAPPRCEPRQREAEVRFVEASARRLVLEVASESPGYLVVSDLLLPGWEARVDGQLVPLLHANVAGRAVAIGAGRRRVEMRYAPASLRYGALISAAGLLLLLGLSWYRRRTDGGSRAAVPPRHEPGPQPQTTPGRAKAAGGRGRRKKARRRR